jgi:type I restriction enzyme S subunit
MYPLRCKDGILPEFLLGLLLSDTFTDFATAESVRAQLPKINRESLFAFRFRLPPARLQGEFASRVEQIRSILSQQYAATKKARAAFEALLARVFASGSGLDNGAAGTSAEGSISS